MPKSQFIDPNEIRKKGKIKFKDIDVNQYSKSIEDEKKNFSCKIDFWYNVPEFAVRKVRAFSK